MTSLTFSVQKDAFPPSNLKSALREEALVVHSLSHEDGLSQGEIAVLLGRHKSWVCRRLSLVERLSD